MKKNPILVVLFLLALVASRTTARPVDTAELKQQLVRAYLDSMDQSIRYQTGKVAVRNMATLTIPQGYKFVPDSTATWIIQDLWGNPKGSDILGMIVRDSYAPSHTEDWAFVLTYDESGYVKDDDADKIDYDELLKNIQKDEIEENKTRQAAGFPAVHMAGWAAKPYYDKDNKILHWAKELQFGGQDAATLNYDVRILGRKGVLSLNAVGTMDQLADIRSHVPDIIHIAAFNDGNKYSDFNPGMDKVAAYTIGGLVAGKLLAKVGLFALLLKNIKLVLLAIGGLFGAFRKKLGALFNRRKREDEEATEAQPFEPAVVPLVDDAAAHTTDNQHIEGPQS